MPQTYHELKLYAKTITSQYYDLKEEILGLLDLCETEIEEGGSIQHEIDLCYNDINALVKERIKDKV